MMRKDPGLGTRLRQLLELLDGDLDALYAADGQGYRARYTPVMKALAGGRSLTIKEIAAAAGITHSAASQTVSRMVAEGLLDQSVGKDARERKLRLAPRGMALLPALEARWAAVDEAARRLEAEIGLPLSECLAAAIKALERERFQSRVMAVGASPSPPRQDGG